jgi:hypothetical protein
MEFIEPYEVTINMHSGGTLHLALSDQDKILVIRAFVVALPMQSRLVLDFLLALDDFEKRSKPIDIWKLKLDSAQPDPCAVCGSSTRYGNKGEFSLCYEHDNWRTYLKLNRGK